MSVTATVVPNKEIHTQSIASVLGKSRTIRKIPLLDEVKLPSRDARLLVQSPSPSPERATQVVSITGVKANTTAKGVEVILETTVATQLQVINRTTGNNFIVDVLGGQLRLPDGNAFTFRSEKPSAGITQITVANIDLNTVRVTVVGEKALPTVELYDDTPGLVFAVASQATATQPQQPTGETPQQTPEAQGDDSIELVVTGEQDSYRVPNSSIGTRTDTPQRDVPQTINVVPQAVLRDQNATTLTDALLNAPGVTPVQSSRRGQESFFVIRGFSTNTFTLRNGLRRPGGLEDGEVLPNLERVEVLKGPASVLYGRGNLGGTINLVTKQPLRDPFYEVEASVGSYDYYRGTIDLSGPLNESKSLLYRLNAGYFNKGSFVDFYNRNFVSFAPTIRWDIGERTHITVEGEYTRKEYPGGDGSLPTAGSLFPNPYGDIPRKRFIGDPDGYENYTNYRLGYRLEHEFSDNWSIKQSFEWQRQLIETDAVFQGGLADDNRTVIGAFSRRPVDPSDIYTSNVQLEGKFVTGSIGHQLVFGADLSHFDRLQDYRVSSDVALNIFNPNYDDFIPTKPYVPDYSGEFHQNTLGIYLQDLVTLTPQLKLLLGGRLDWFDLKSEFYRSRNPSSLSGNGVFTPRVGIVYQPIEPISLYASYSRSFEPQEGISFEGELFQPERGTQYEVGVKADVNERLAVTLSLFDLTKSGVLTEDRRPGVPLGRFSIQTGEQRSRGVELSVTGEILPGWNIFAGYAYTDAKLTEDNVLPVGNRLELAPENSFNLWTTYQLQRGALQGLGVGLGLFFVGDRERDLANTYELPSYFRTDAAIFYERGRLRAALNFKNLFDVEYFEPGVLGVAYADPFTVQGTISWQF